MKNESQEVLEAMRVLITKSCDLDAVGSTYYPFQKTLLKYFFNADDVSIDYDSQALILINALHQPAQISDLIGKNEMKSSTINYSSLDETLKGCLEKDSNAIKFYKIMLFQYNNVNTEIEPIHKSA